MYLNFFQFTERPFTLTPSSQMLFSSKSHSAALDYLNYGIKEKKGFILITGEVGTGKTTLCRKFLKTIGKNIEAAVILNSFLTEIELLRAINRDFGIDASGETREQLIHTLNLFLLKKKQQQKTPVVIIDESQNLSPSVLEQIRMLSNLETENEKLLQIVLLGQPELEETLAEHNLRQLNQRITVRFQIKPLTLKETIQYIQQRLQTCSKGKVLPCFTRGAYAKIHAASRGFPRQINALCDYVLLGAYVRETFKIKQRIVNHALKELKWNKPRQASPYFWKVSSALAASSAIMLLAFALFNIKNPYNTGKTIPAQPLSASPALAKVIVSPPQNFKPKVVNLPPAKIQTFSQQNDALLKLASLWLENDDVYEAIQLTQSEEDYFHQVGFQHIETWAGLQTLAKINFPAVLQAKHPETAEETFMILTKLNGDKATLLAEKNREIILSCDALKKMWHGKAYIIYKDPEGGNYSEVYIRNMKGDGIELMQKRLFELGYLTHKPTGIFDQETQTAVETFQQAMGLPIDGIAGTETQLALFHLCYQENIPYLVHAEKPQETLITYSDETIE